MRNRMPRPDGADGQQTIRILVFVPITLLLLTIVVFAALTGQFNDSISAYYGGPARDVFVGCLTAAALGVGCGRGVQRAGVGRDARARAVHGLLGFEMRRHLTVGTYGSVPVTV